MEERDPALRNLTHSLRQQRGNAPSALRLDERNRERALIGSPRGHCGPLRFLVESAVYGCYEE